MNLETLEKSGQIIFKYIAGSHSYGTNVETSDVDYRGIFVTPLKDRITIKNKIPEIGPPETTGQIQPKDVKYYELEKFFNLAKDCNPNIIEFLWAPEDCIEICTPSMKKLLQHRDLFISKRAYHTFTGYAHSQLKKSRGTNRWVNNPKPKEKPSKEQYCYLIPFNNSSQYPARPIPLTEYSINFKDYKAAKLEHVPNMYRLYHFPYEGKVFDDGDIICSSVEIDKEKDFFGFLVFNKELYLSDVKDWENYWTWKKERNPHRWLAQENKECDYDSKFFMYCIRLLLSGENILKNGEPIVKFSGEELKLLLDIRHNKYSYEELMNIAEKKMETIQLLSETSSLSWNVDINKIDSLFREIIYDQL